VRYLSELPGPQSRRIASPRDGETADFETDFAASRYRRYAMNMRLPVTIPSLLTVLCAVWLAAGASLAAAEPATSRQPDVNPRVLTFIKPIAASESDDELTKKLKERHNVATSLLEARVAEYKTGVSDLTLVLEAARLVAEAKHDLAQDDAARLAVLGDTLEISKLIESHQQAKFDAGVGSKSDLQRARLARLSVEVQILKMKRAAAPKKP
jgi:hypothetical protein